MIVGETDVDLILQIGLSNVLMAGVLALVAAMAGRFWRRPALTHALWLLVLIKLLTPPLVPVPIFWSRAAAPQPAVALVDSAPLPDAPVAEDEKAAADVGVDEVQAPAEPGELLPGERPALRVEQAGVHVAAPRAGPPDKATTVIPAEWSWPIMLGIFWLAGSACWLLLVVGRIRRFRPLLVHARAAPVDVQEQAKMLADRMHVRCPTVRLVPGVVSPMLWVAGRACSLLLPENLLERLSGEQRATLLAHELAHLRRGDPWVRYLELAVLACYWWCPLVWWARSELREAEEECCDAWVLWALPGSGRAYALALVETVDFLADARTGLPLLASGFGHVQTLRRRLTMIMRGTTPRALTASGAITVLAVAALLLPLLPTWAQPLQEDPLPAAKAKQKQLQEDARHKELQSMVKDLEKARAQLAVLAEELKRKEEALLRLTNEIGKKQQYRALNALGAVRDPMPPPRPGVETRLRELEKKLAEALREVQELRRQLKGTPPGALRPVPAPYAPANNTPYAPPGYVPVPKAPPLGYVMPLKNVP
jgi:beta-lactamase regulating signal transducer with metallopeptidase domain